MDVTANVLKNLTPGDFQKGLDKRCKIQISLIRLFPVCYSGKHFLNQVLKTNVLFGEQKREREKC